MYCIKSWYRRYTPKMMIANPLSLCILGVMPDIFFSIRSMAPAVRTDTAMSPAPIPSAYKLSINTPLMIPIVAEYTNMEKNMGAVHAEIPRP